MYKKKSVKAIGERTITEAELLSRPLEREAFDDLTTKRHHVDRQELLTLLQKIPGAPDSPLQIVEGMRDKSVRELPERVRHFARTIAAVNASPWVGPNSWRNHEKKRRVRAYPTPLKQILQTESDGSVVSGFLALPVVLKLYADVLEALLNTFHPVGDKKKQLGGFRALQLRKWYTMELLFLVKSSTGAEHYEQIATLLSRAYELADAPKTITETDLAQFKRNNDYYALLAHLKYFG